MCGIVGQIGSGGGCLAHAMCDALAHRGPDDEGFYRTQGAILGHRRLSIIDLSGGHQPISNEDESVWVVFNGEIYNFEEIRANLEKKGHTFRTASDTEVIVHAYEEYGEACPQLFCGMFAFAVWDERNQTLFAARDHIGVKPLYYSTFRSNFLFASEIKAILAAGVPREIDYESLDDYLTYLYTVPPRTIYRSIRQLPPAHFMTWHNGQLRVQRYWKLDYSPESHSERYWVEEVQSCLSNVIRGNLVADVPLGSFLSGGMDSSTIVATMRQVSREPIQTFTIGFGKDGNLYDEVSQARTLASHFGTHHHELRAEREIKDVIPSVVSHFDEPFGNPTAILVYILSDLIRRHVKVVLAGDGGDEVFGGYTRYLGASWSERYRFIPASVRRSLINPMVQMLPESTRGHHMLRRIREFSSGTLLSSEEMYTSWITYFSATERRSLYTEDLTRCIGAHDSQGYVRDLFRECDATDFVSKAMYVDMLSFLPNNVLQYSDRMSMAHGLEIRVPFTDPRLVELMSRVPSSLKVTGKQSKYLMRKAMQGVLPQDVLRRKKLGFNPPMGVWLTTFLADHVEELLSKETLESRGYFRPDAVHSLLERHRSGRRDFTWHIWSLIIFEIWHRMYID